MEVTMQSSNEQLIESFYSAFQHLDWRTMTECYHPQAQFSDPVFVLLNAQEVTDMWHMLCSKARDFDLKYSHI